MNRWIQSDVWLGRCSSLPFHCQQRKKINFFSLSDWTNHFSRKLFLFFSFSELGDDGVTLEWRPSSSSNHQSSIIGYKLFVNHHLKAILASDQLSYTLMNGSACEEYLIHLQTLTDDRTKANLLSPPVKFTWPGIKPGKVRRLDHGRTGLVLLQWEDPQLAESTDKILAFKVINLQQNDKELRCGFVWFL